ncbi:Uncharacterised protein [Bordetella pertussis]|nr:Uncharacterised protein [Bordetella pertussis]
MAEDAVDLLVHQLLGHLHGNARIGLVVARDQHELGGLAAHGHALLICFFQRQRQTVLHVFAVMGLRAGQGRREAELDIGRLGHTSQAGGGNARCQHFDGGAQGHGFLRCVALDVNCQ